MGCKLEEVECVAETDPCPDFPGFLSHPGKTHSLKQEEKKKITSNFCFGLFNYYPFNRVLTSNHSFSTAFWNIGSQSELHQVDVPILNKEKLTFFQGAKWGCILGSTTKNCLTDAQKDKKHVSSCIHMN